MTSKSILKAVIILLACITLGNCNKEKAPCSDDQPFCSLADNQDFNDTGSIINNYLSGLKKNKKDENLAELINWLECKSCVDRAQLICNSCIKTNPPISEISIDFISNGQKITMVMDISMEEPLKYVAYHE